MGSTSQEACYLALLGLAEEFRTMNPPNIRNCIQCLLAIFNLKQPPKIEARTHLQLGNILLQYTKNTDLAQSHLEKAVRTTFSASFFKLECEHLVFPHLRYVVYYHKCTTLAAGTKYITSSFL